MKRTSTGIARWVGSVCVVLAGCSGPLRPDEGPVEQRAQALSGPPVQLFVFAPTPLYFPTPVRIGATAVNQDRLNPVSDVTVTMAVTGAFTPGSFFAFNPGPVPCTLDTSTPGTAIVTCHADTVTGNPFQVNFGVAPTAAGSIKIVTTLLVAGQVVQTDSRQVEQLLKDSADVSVNGFPDSFAFVGQPAQAFFYGNNFGPLPATDVHLTFQLSGPATITSVAPPDWFYPPQPACSVGPTTADCAVSGALQPFGSVPYAVIFTPTAPGTVSVQASISAAELDRVLWNNSTQTFTPVYQPMYADLAIAMTAEHPAIVGKAFKYTLTVNNQGPDPAASAIVNDYLPPGMTLVSASPSQGSCSDTPWGFFTCDLGGLAAGAAANIVLTVMPTAPATATNTASVYDPVFGDIDTNFDNDNASMTVTVHGRPNLADHPPPTRGGCGLWPGIPIDNLEDGDTFVTPANKQVGGWFVTSDGTGAQTPSSVDGLVVPGGPGPSKYMVHSTGSDFQIWGAALGMGWNCPYDVSRFRGVRFAVKAGGMGFFFVEIPTAELQSVDNGGQCTSNCFDFYRLPVSLPDDGWYECTVAFKDLAQAGWGMQAPFDVGAVMGTQFNLEVWNAPYDLSLDDIRFVATPNLKSGCVLMSH